MVWVIVLSAVVVLALAAWAGAGNLGEMPEPVNDRPKGYLPKLPFGEEFVADLRLPVVAVGYDRTQVDEFIKAALRTPSSEVPVFDTSGGGYDMQAVDQVVDRVHGHVRSLADGSALCPASRAMGAETTQAEVSDSPVVFEDAE
ncbi:MAG: hypothetical protein Q4D79_00295 [Propionibacteriaceae bacterium]|nr:hypothetical protein [Propionibacteriaceae bacterium]